MSALTGEIVLIGNKDNSINYKWEKQANNIDSHLQVIAIEDIDKYDNLCIQDKLGLPITPIEGMMLAKNPFNPSMYIPVTDFQYYIADAKFLAISKIAALLGAKKVSYKYTLKDVKQRDKIIDGKIKYKAFSGEAEYKEKLNETMEFDSTKTIEFPGKHCDKKAYNLAIEEAKRTGLINDKEINMMLSNRHPDHPNPMSHYSSDISLSRETTNYMDIAFTISVLGDWPVFKLNVGVNDTITTKSSINLHVEWFFESH